MTREQVYNTVGKKIQIKAINDGVIYAPKQRKYKKGDIFDVNHFGSMLFFFPNGESSSFWDFELIKQY